ncbi:hypothetical protein L1987_01949 [Smallanthus sonchifolius]|uniref:Uncharacterized protein n=1 Tax=Smallanthus sonchifolius TaxID=185202 RepID=A0ACB9K6H5_9ASTR|nr:hypothetical protein L1987_01949 [Smallanthus sonchifolius]
MADLQQIQKLNSFCNFCKSSRHLDELISLCFISLVLHIYSLLQHVNFICGMAQFVGNLLSLLTLNELHLFKRTKLQLRNYKCGCSKRNQCGCCMTELWITSSTLSPVHRHSTLRKI